MAGARPDSPLGFTGAVMLPLRRGVVVILLGWVEDIFSGVVSTELGLSLETQRHRGRQDHMDKPLLFSIALMNLSLFSSFFFIEERHGVKKY